ncbi:hypothetical protein STFR1_10303 [Bacillus vallismortis]
MIISMNSIDKTDLERKRTGGIEAVDHLYYSGRTGKLHPYRQDA